MYDQMVRDRKGKIKNDGLQAVNALSQLPDQIAMRFQRLYLCFRVRVIQGDYSGYIVRSNWKNRYISVFGVQLFNKTCLKRRKFIMRLNTSNIFPRRSCEPLENHVMQFAPHKPRVIISRLHALPPQSSVAVTQLHTFYSSCYLPRRDGSQSQGFKSTKLVTMMYNYYSVRNCK